MTQTDLQHKRPAAEYVDPKTLLLWEDNPRKNDSAIGEVMRSIEEYGFGAPIVARQENREVIAGHTRLKAALKMKLKEVPVRFLDIDEATAHRMARADNRLGEKADWDVDKLIAQLQAEQEAGANIGAQGWTEAELERMLKSVEAPKLGHNTQGAPDERLDALYATDVRQLVLYFTADEYEPFVRQLEEVRARLKLETNTEAVTRLVRDAAEAT
jgi:ParB-like chromosome segregation protein Spo0J